ncbi:MAG: hypothetical protein JRM84_06065 [Nitrososphaerota archaeon]|nr:hypothetical protein [Nitrososphaerota archaeon]
MSCEHKMAYEGAINIIIKGEVDGTIDIWKCKNCGGTAADLRRIGEPKMPESVGMGTLAEIGRWGVIACNDHGETEWHLTQSASTISHNCNVFGKCELTVDEKGSIKCSNNHDHKFYFISNYINSSLVIG